MVSVRFLARIVSAISAQAVVPDIAHRFGTYRSLASA
jgi:hypothetical protein